jgi:O-antigen/teichoic acid export membrane protein
MRINRVMRNTLALFSGQTGAQVLALVFMACLTKTIPEGEVGNLAFAFNFVVLLNVLSEFGLWTLIVRDVARNLPLAAEYFWNSLVLKTVLAGLAALLGWAVLTLFYPDPALRTLCWIAMAWLLFNAWYFSAAAMFRAFQEHHLDGVLSFVGKLVYVLGGVVVIFTVRDTRWIAAAFTLAMGAQCLAAIVLVLRRHPALRFTCSLARQAFLLRHALLFFTINAFTTLHLKFALMVIGKVCTRAEIAYFNIASMLVLVPIVLANAFVQSMYPVLSECHAQGDAAFWPKVKLGMRWLAALAFPVIFFMSIDGGRMLTGVFKREYVAGLVPLQILLWGLGLDFFNPFSGHVLYVLNRQKTVIAVTAASVATNIIANLVLTPRYGIIGASCAMVISLSVMFWGYALTLRRWLPLTQLFGRILPPLLVAGALAPLAWWLRAHVPFVVNGAVYCAACAAAYFGLGLLRREDVHMFAAGRGAASVAPDADDITVVNE